MSGIPLLIVGDAMITRTTLIAFNITGGHFIESIFLFSVSWSFNRFDWIGSLFVCCRGTDHCCHCLKFWIGLDRDRSPQETQEEIQLKVEAVELFLWIGVLIVVWFFVWGLLFFPGKE
jgi:hypothetical protein